MVDRSEVSVSRAALLELRRERELIEQGHRFLDEKRMQLARELLHRLDEWQALMADMQEAEASARGALIEAVTAYGIADMQMHPAFDVESAEWSRDQDQFLGLDLPAMGLAIMLDGFRETAAVDRPLLEVAGSRYAGIVEIASRAAALLTSMLRLYEEFKRTERSVRALENVVMPEIRELEKVTDEALAELEQEEAVRVRLFARR